MRTPDPRPLLGVAVALAVLTPLAWMWQGSRLPSTYSVMDLGYPDPGGGRVIAGSPRHGVTSVADLRTDPGRRADHVVDLVARQETFRLASGRRVSGFTLDHRSPGPRIVVRQGDLLEVRLRNASVAGGVTLHWHGVDVPNAEDGVAGVTQDAVPIGGDHTYRFVADDPGTYWYHSHQVSHEQVAGGLFGSLVVLPRHPVDPPDMDVTVVSHVYDAVPTLDGVEGDLAVRAPPGSRVRVRVVNTDNGGVRVWASVPYRLTAVDAHAVHRPGPVTDRAVTVPAGGRAELEVVTPATGVARVQVGAASAVVLGSDTSVRRPPPAPEPTADLDLLQYGTPAPLRFDPGAADRRFDYDIGRRLGFYRGRPGLWWTVNGHVYPDLPMFVVESGDVVRLRIVNHSGDVHPMHLHGHHAVVLMRDGERSTGSPWWFDSLNVQDGETYEVAFVADNPGILMDHCHNLNHAAQGLVTHLMYAGVSEPYRVGGATDNEPE